MSQVRTPSVSIVGIDTNAIAMAIKQYEQAVLALPQIGLAPVFSTVASVSPFGEFSRPNDIVTEEDVAIAESPESRCVIGMSKRIKAIIGNLKIVNPAVKSLATPQIPRYAAVFKSGEKNSTLELSYPSVEIQKSLATKKLLLFGAMIHLNSLTMTQFVDCRLYVNIKAREGEFGFGEDNGDVYRKISAVELMQKKGVLENFTLVDHALSADDTAMMRVFGADLMPENFAEQYKSVPALEGWTVPDESPVYHKYKKLGHPDLKRVFPEKPVVFMSNAMFEAIAPGIKSIMDNWFAHVDPTAIEFRVELEDVVNEKGESVETSFRSAYQRPAKSAAAGMAEHINFTLDATLTCHTCPCRAPEAKKA